MKPTKFDIETGQRLKKLRKKKGMKQEWMAMRLGISSNYISMLESGIRRWHGEIIKKYEDLLK